MARATARGAGRAVLMQAPEPESPLWKRLAWMAAIWAISVAALWIVSILLRWVVVGTD